MNTLQIQTICENVKELHPNFIGVFPYDKIPVQEVESDKFCVVNFDPSYKDGSHWIAIILRPKKKKNIYFDSYGQPPPVGKPRFSHVLKHNYKWNKHQLQHPLSTACGQWCIFFVCAYFSNHSLAQINNYFSSKNDLLKNDYAINAFVNSLLPYDDKYDVVNKSFINNQFALPMKDVLQ